MEKQKRMCRTTLSVRNEYHCGTAHPGADVMALNGGDLYPENNAYLGCWGCARLDALFLMGVGARCACVWKLFLLMQMICRQAGGRGARWEPETK